MKIAQEEISPRAGGVASTMLTRSLTSLNRNQYRARSSSLDS